MIPEIDGLRGIAILLVLWMHFWPNEGVLSAVWPASQRGWIGVDLFFVISGFLITGILLDSRGGVHYYRNFYLRRVLRIFPLHYLFLAVVFIGVPLMQGAPYAESIFGQKVGSPWWFILFLSNIRQMVSVDLLPFYLLPLWSLAIEEQFYLVFPWIVNRLSPRRLPHLLGGVVLLAIVVRTVLSLVWPTHYGYDYLFTLARADAIALGCLAAVLLRQHPERLVPAIRRWGLIGGSGVLVATMAVTDGLDRHDLGLQIVGYSLIALGWLGIMLWAITAAGAPATAWLRWAPLRFIGRLCFGLYVLHLAVREVVLRVVEGFAPGLPGWEVLQVPVLLATATLVAWISWQLIEAPFQRLKTRFAYTPSSTAV